MAVVYIQCPNHPFVTYNKFFSQKIFLAGGITQCPDWQSYASKIIIRNIHKSNSVYLFNPRRESSENINIREQILWEHRYLYNSDIILFWFPQETLCPITLFEYGKYLKSDKQLFVGCHKNYARKEDLFIQTKLERPNLSIITNLDELLYLFVFWMNCQKC